MATVTPAATDILIYAKQELQRSETLSFAEGHAVIYSSAHPERETPNEDVAALIPYETRTGVLLVADGAGGIRQSAEAALITARSIRKSLARGLRDELRLRGAVLNGIERAHQEVIKQGCGATTVAIVQIKDGTVRSYHVGDSSVLVVGQRGRIKHQSLAHAPVSYAVEAGMLDEHEALEHEERHVVSNLIGTDNLRIEIGPILKLAPRDTVLIASDGLSDNLYESEIIEIVRKGPLTRAADRLATLAHQRMKQPDENRPSKPDDLTFVLYRRAKPSRSDRS